MQVQDDQSAERAERRREGDGTDSGLDGGGVVAIASGRGTSVRVGVKGEDVGEAVEDLEK